MEKNFSYLILSLLFLTVSNLSAQICKIGGSNDSVEVFSCNISGNNVEVTVSNDSNDVNANVTVTVDVVYKNNNLTQKKTYTGKGLAKKLETTIIKIPIQTVENFSPVEATVVGISGSKCL